MKSKLLVCLTLLSLTLSLPAIVEPAVAQDSRSSRELAARDTRKADKGPIKSPTGASFNLAPNPENPVDFTLVMTDGEETVVTGLFAITELQELKSIMVEAKKFAFTEEGVNANEAVTTRFSSKAARAFLIDVRKAGNLSYFYISMNTESGFITLEAGSVKRTDKREEGFYFDVLARVESQLPKPTAQPVK